MMTQTVKTAISLPGDAFAQLETARKGAGISRSQAIAQAVALWLRDRRRKMMEDRYYRGYMNHPEGTDGHKLYQAGLSSFGKGEW